MRLLVPAVLLLALHAAPARAAQSYDNCTGFIDTLPAVISSPGIWCLRKDLATSINNGNAVTIDTNNVTLECNHFKIGGLGAGLGTLASGVAATNRLNATLRNCNIRGFFFGANLQGGSGHLLEGNRFDGNTRTAINLLADGSILRHNHVVDTGGSTLMVSQAIGIKMSGAGNEGVDNNVFGVDQSQPSGQVMGIYFHAEGGSGSLGRNTVGGLDPDTTGAIYGIYADAENPIIHENVVWGIPGNPAGRGIHCADNRGTARANIVARFAIGIENCVISGNVVNPN